MSELHGYMTVMLDAGDVAAGLREAQAQRYDAADLDLGWAASTDAARANLCAVEHGPAESFATNGHFAMVVPCAAPLADGRRTRLTPAGSSAAAKLAKDGRAAKWADGREGGVRLSAFGGYVTADNAAGQSCAEVENEPGAAMPDIRMVVPADLLSGEAEGCVEVTVSAAYLAKIASYFAKHGAAKRSPAITLRFGRDNAATGPVVIVGDVDGGLGPRKATAVLMPLRA